MGLRLKYNLSARGGGVRCDAALLSDLVGWLRREHLLEERGAQCSILWSDGSSHPDGDAWLSLDQAADRLREAVEGDPRVITVSNLRTSERFPNLFPEYTDDEASLGAYLSLRVVRGTSPAGRGFEMEFTEVDFLADAPAVSFARLLSYLEGALGARPVTGCYNADPAEMLES